MLVLLAFVAGSALAMIPITPGGLGFVEAGLTGVLTLAGVTPEHAVLATLLYRLFSYWLPLPSGLVASFLFRRRHRERVARRPRLTQGTVDVGAGVTSVVGASTESGSVVGGTVDGGPVVAAGRVVDVVVELVVVVGSAAAAGHDNVANAVSPHAKRLATFHVPSTSTTLPTNGYGVSKCGPPSAITE